MKIRKAIANLAENKLDEMRRNVHAVLAEKVIEKLEEKKVELAETLVIGKK
jgi:pyruvate formate-lyase activating enzyme-like uncharacterized protein